MVKKDFFGEGRNIEFKREIPDRHEKFLKDIIAFSNSTGGKVILGIEDETCIVYGIGDQSPFKLSDAISNMVSDACTPQIEPDIRIQTIEDKTVLIIDVAPGKFRPYYIASKGKETTTFVRINGTSRPADPRKLKELELEGQNISYDSLQEIGKEFDEQKAFELCRKMRQIAIASCKTEEQKDDVRDMTLEKLEDFGLLCKVGRNLYPTHAFVLMTDNKNKAAKIQCALFKGNTRDIFIDQKEFTGPIYEQVEDAYQFVLRHINTGAEIEGIFRNDSYELPPSAIREMVTNAVTHRSYLDRSCIQVSIFDDRVEVLSPGSLYGGMDLETAKLGKSKCRNEAIAEAFHYMHIVEAWGTGLPRIISRCKKYGLPVPVFEEFGDGFKVIMFRKVSSTAYKASNIVHMVSSGQAKVSSTAQNVASGEKKVSNTFTNYLPLLDEADITATFVHNIERVFDKCGTDMVFGQANIMKWLDCSKSKATNVMNAMKAAKIITKVTGLGAGRYKFIVRQEDK